MSQNLGPKTEYTWKDMKLALGLIQPATEADVLLRVQNQNLDPQEIIALTEAVDGDNMVFPVGNELEGQLLFFRWGGEFFKTSHKPTYQEAAKYIGISKEHRGGREERIVKFFIRSLHDPIGSCSPTLIIYEDTKLEEIFDWYLLQTYSGPLDTLRPHLNPETKDKFCFMEIDFVNRTLGSSHYYSAVKGADFTYEDTAWAKSRRRKITIVSSDRCQGYLQKA